VPKGPITKEIFNKYLKSLRAGSEAKASSAINTALRREVSPLDIYMKILLPAQREMGELWMENKISIADEHLATEITLTQMNRLRPTMRPTKRHGHKAVVTSVEGDQHYIAARVASDFLYVDGWDVDFLGPSTPAADLAVFISERKVHLLILSVTLADLTERAAYTIKKVKDLEHQPKIIMGGHAIFSKEHAINELGADAFARDPLEICETARDLCSIPSRISSLDEILTKLGERIQTLRKSNGMSQLELAKSAGLDRAYISGLENGKQNVSLGAVVKIATALDMPLEELIVSKTPNHKEFMETH
jgi:methanogenic corrinoid protein MtbC1/DNA-binding XRE family transcriptional regulator